MPRLVSRADFARECRRSKPAITKACRGALAPACVGDRIDIDHEAAQAYAQSSGVVLSPADAAPTAKPRPAPKTTGAPTRTKKSKPSRAAKPTALRPEPPPPPPTVAAPDSMSELEEIRALLKPLVERFGTSRYFADWLQSLRTIEIILEKHLGNEESQGRLVSRELVRVHIFGALNAMARRLLQDSPKTIARRLAAHFNAKGTVEEAERIVRENIGSQIEPVKAKTSRALREGGPLDLN